MTPLLEEPPEELLRLGWNAACRMIIRHLEAAKDENHERAIKVARGLVIKKT